MLAINNGMQHLKKSLLFCYKVDVYYFNHFYYIHLPYLRLSLNVKIKPLSMQSKGFTRVYYMNFPQITTYPDVKSQSMSPAFLLHLPSDPRTVQIASASG